MTLPPTSRCFGFVPILFFPVLSVLAGCTPATREPAPVIQADPSVAAGTKTGPDQTDMPTETVDPTQPDRTAAQPDDNTDRFLPESQIVRIGLMLPFSHPVREIGQQAETILAGAELALFESGVTRLVLELTDSGDSPRLAEQAAIRLKQANVDVVLGPLLDANIEPVRTVMADTGIPVITFSDNRPDGDAGVWRATIDLRDEVIAIVRHARWQGYGQFVFFGPESDSGRQIEAAMHQAVIVGGGSMLLSSFYPVSQTHPDAEAMLCAAIIAQAVENGEKVALFIPERGNRLRQIAPLLAYHGVDTRQVRLLGTSAWNDSAIWREPILRGAWFPAPPLQAITDFKARFRNHYGGVPDQSAALAHDVVTLIARLGTDGVFNWQDLLAEAENGFMGINGLFRFRDNGDRDHAFAIMEIDPDTDYGIREIQPVQQGFDLPTGQEASP